MDFKKYFLISVLITLFHCFNSELFTALADLSKVFKAEKDLGELLSQYVVNEEKRLGEIIQFANELKTYNINSNKSSDNSEEIEKYFSNPINSYLFTRKFVFDWKDKLELLNDFVNNKFRKLLQEEIDRFQKRLPVEEDIDGTIDALIRLQETYKLNTKDLIVGKIQNVQSNVKLNSNDCYKIGLHAYEKGNYPVAVKWFKESLNLFKVNKLDEHNTLSERSIVDYLSYCLGSVGMFSAALNYTNEMLQSPNSDIRQRLMDNKKYYLQKISEEEYPNDSEDPAFNEHRDGNEYTALCRGESPMNHRHNWNNLICRYAVPDPFYVIGPLKTEVAFDKPRIVIFHDIIHNKEIDHIKAVASPNLNRATVRNPTTGILEFASYRISKSAWLSNDLDDITYKINQRIKAATGLSIETAEDLQVVNYGIGGHYSPHFDHGNKRPQDAFETERGNRIATLLFYLSDVEAGGATVFTEVGAILWPKKGSAAFWFNLRRNGESDDMTKHAGCPVLVGSKWVMNKWFHEREQEFRRPCKLKNV